ncbi:MAG TPA: DUF58 domain-containing protein [Thermodesulfobacteriota bacterium]|nr:DUF58 domain-containing protein [Thermodesulfobacteriota bacterium]
MLLDPALVRSLERLTLTTRRTLRGLGQGDRRVHGVGRSVEFHDYRAYQPGDDLRYLDWHAYGRLDRLVLKLYLNEVDLLVQVLLDASGSMAVGQPRKSTYALQLAAALGYVGLASLERVAVGYVAAGRAGWLPPVRGRGSFPRVLRFLEAIAFEGETALNRALAAEARRLPRRSRLVLISDLLDPAGYQEGLLALQAAGHDLFLLHLVAPEELEPPELGAVRLVDVESGGSEELTLSGEQIAAYQARALRYFAEVEAFCLRRGIGYLRASTGLPLDELLFRHLAGGRLFR